MGIYIVIIEAAISPRVDRPHRNVRTYPVARWNLDKEITATAGYVIVAVQLLTEDSARPYFTTQPQATLPDSVSVPDPEPPLRTGERRSMWQ